ncbi:hypothetical protein TI39_contig5820g00001 [Zymoseptoria brevis]|uniref:Uncharacterized protein n=1 Tax=Zymoseptoria brevis TaxID=1047168 RepID=A0A0F4G681_9PEZI|nr:hypothetical protein TI39_contig5820g00001 [Zymoseptoria brevis]
MAKRLLSRDTADDRAASETRFGAGIKPMFESTKVKSSHPIQTPPVLLTPPILPALSIIPSLTTLSLNASNSATSPSNLFALSIASSTPPAPPNHPANHPFFSPFPVSVSSFNFLNMTPQFASPVCKHSLHFFLASASVRSVFTVRRVPSLRKSALAIVTACFVHPSPSSRAALAKRISPI